jgi:hypothetical protein
MPSFTSFSEITLALQKSRLHQFTLGIRRLPAYGRARRIGRVKPARCSPKKTFFVIGQNKALAQEGAAKIPSKESCEPDFSNGTADNNRRNWLFWLAA